MDQTGMITKISGREFTNFGRRMVATQMRFSLLQAHFEVDHEVQRKIDPKRRLGIRQFIIDSLDKAEDIFFSPFIFSARNGINVLEDGLAFEPGRKIYIIDGQHRGAAIASALSYYQSLKEGQEEMGNFDEAENIQRKIDILNAYPISMQIYLDLNQQEERQLFSDINTERRQAHVGLIMQYDYRDGYTTFTRQIADQLNEEMEIDFEKSRLTTYSSAVTSLATMRKCLIALFEGILTVKNGDPYPKGVNPAKMPEIANEFFHSWKLIFPKEMMKRSHFVSGLSGIQIALAYTVFLLTRKYSVTHKVAINMLLTLKNCCSWKHTDPLFTHMYNHETGKITHHSSTTSIQRTATKFLLEIDRERNLPS